jgi:flagellar hook assembly protein FlgD
MQGIKIKTLHDEQMASGRHETFWDGTNSLAQNVSTGEYFCVMRAESFTKTIRLLLVK